MTESQEFFLVVRGTGAGIDSAIFLKIFIVMLLVDLGKRWAVISGDEGMTTSVAFPCVCVEEEKN